MAGDCMRILCELAVIKPIPTGNSYGPPDECDRLSVALKHLEDDDSLTDVTLLSGGRQIKAHRVVLATRSPSIVLLFT